MPDSELQGSDIRIALDRIGQSRTFVGCDRPDYDPKADNIARSRARRLRARLTRYLHGGS